MLKRCNCLLLLKAEEVVWYKKKKKASKTHKHLYIKLDALKLDSMHISIGKFNHCLYSSNSVCMKTGSQTCRAACPTHPLPSSRAGTTAAAAAPRLCRTSCCAAHMRGCSWDAPGQYRGERNVIGQISICIWWLIHRQIQLSYGA